LEKSSEGTPFFLAQMAMLDAPAAGKSRGKFQRLCTVSVHAHKIADSDVATTSIRGKQGKIETWATCRQPVY
jgi:hypothetical protein